MLFLLGMLCGALLTFALSCVLYPVRETELPDDTDEAGA
jgi:hypothetical protein